MVDNKVNIVDNNTLLNELIMRQLKNVPQDKKLQYTDLKRICKYTKTSIFDPNNCSIWSGYVTNANNTTKGTYVNFYFRKKKAALHRLLYVNYIGELLEDEYLKFSCDNKGKCCNIEHLKKFKYQKKEEKQDVPKKPKSKSTKTRMIKIISKDDIAKDDADKLYISFD